MPSSATRARATSVPADAEETDPVIRTLLTGPSAWRADTVDAAKSWYVRIPERLLAATLDAKDPPASRYSEAIREDCLAHLQALNDALERGRGFVILTAPEREFSEEQWRKLYWMIGLELGQPVEQNVQGTLLYDVRDTGQDVRYGARFSVTNAESSFHTDASFFDNVVDYVGLLCLQPARAGGVSQLVSGCSVHNELLTRFPEQLAVLYQPFHVDRRGGVRPGESPTAQFPVLSEHADGILFRYLRYWIEAGHGRIEQPLTAPQREALDTLDRVLAEPSLRVEFTMRRGDALLFNNRWLLHNRTAFEDFTEPERRRHLVRLWLSRS